MNNINNIKLIKISYKNLLENNQNEKRIVKVDLANENYSKKINFDFLRKSELLLLSRKLLVDKRERERERESKSRDQEPPTRGTAANTKSSPVLFPPCSPTPPRGSIHPSHHLS